jgi:hypothetical protein
MVNCGSSVSAGAKSNNEGAHSTPYKLTCVTWPLIIGLSKFKDNVGHTWSAIMHPYIKAIACEEFCRRLLGGP